MKEVVGLRHKKAFDAMYRELILDVAGFSRGAIESKISVDIQGV